MTRARTAVVTGAARGLGAAIATRLAADGLRVVVLDRDQEVERLAAELGPDCVGVVADLGDEAGVEEATLALERLVGGCDVLVNNAGIHPKQADGSKYPLEAIDIEQWHRVLAVNLTAPFLLGRWAIGHMRSRGWGRIVNIASRAGRTYVPVAGAHYSATKAGVVGLTRTMAGEAGPHGITVNCVAPGRIETPLSSLSTDEAKADFAASSPLGRIGAPTDIAAAVSYLVSDDAGFVTGATLDVNGGSFG